MEHESGDTMMMMEEREEMMVPPGGGKPTLRTAHFLTPTQVFTQNYSSFPISSNPITIPESRKNELNVVCPGWRYPQKGWKEWVDQLKPLYGHIWKKAGIFDAIVASTYKIFKDKDLVMKLAEKWCLETNTFVFSWGEATITLEDIMILGGYPVLGNFIISPLNTDDMLGIEAKLCKAHAAIRQTTGQTTRESSWILHFIGRGEENLEHEAFLAFWLSRYVFPGYYDIVGKDVLLIAINLSRGIPIALAPAVLASIYRALGLLKKSLVDLSNPESGECANNETKLFLCASLGLVQIWVWERFSKLMPEPNPIELGEPRLARWHQVEILEVEDVRKALDSAGEYFQWRPYAIIVRNWIFKLYKENEQYALVGPDMDSEVESLVRCWRNSVLVGIDCIEQYLPHRVAMQFGFDQDLPGFVKRANDHTAEIAWNNYNRPVRDAKIYIPARLFDSDVTKRYSEWRDQLKLGIENATGNVDIDDDDDGDDNIPLDELFHLPKEKLTAAEKCGHGNDSIGIYGALQVNPGDKSLLSSSKNDDLVKTTKGAMTIPLKSDGENLGGVLDKSTTANVNAIKGKERLVNIDKKVNNIYNPVGEPLEPKFETSGDGSLAGKESPGEVAEISVIENIERRSCRNPDESAVKKTIIKVAMPPKRTREQEDTKKQQTINRWQEDPFFNECQFTWTRERPDILYPVRDQKAQGSCYAFGYLRQMEAHNLLKGVTKKFTPLSRQHLVDNFYHRDKGQQVPDEDEILKFLEKEGVYEERCYRYRDTELEKGQELIVPESTKNAKRRFYIESSHDYSKKGIKKLKMKKRLSRLIRDQPLTGFLKYYPSFDSCNDKDIYMGPTSQEIKLAREAAAQAQLDKKQHTVLGHSVLIVGDGEVNGVKYFLVQNSWGEEDWGKGGWGKGGFGKINQHLIFRIFHIEKTVIKDI